MTISGAGFTRKGCDTVVSSLSSILPLFPVTPWFASDFSSASFLQNSVSSAMVFPPETFATLLCCSDKLTRPEFPFSELFDPIAGAIVFIFTESSDNVESFFRDDDLPESLLLGEGDLDLEYL